MITHQQQQQQQTTTFRSTLSVVASLPKHATVLFVLGEIDLPRGNSGRDREGPVGRQAVQKKKKRERERERLDDDRGRGGGRGGGMRTP
jgi:hypothetical protein